MKAGNAAWTHVRQNQLAPVSHEHQRIAAAPVLPHPFISPTLLAEEQRSHGTAYPHGKRIELPRQDLQQQQARREGVDAETSCLGKTSRRHMGGGAENNVYCSSDFRVAAFLLGRALHTSGSTSLRRAHSHPPQMDSRICRPAVQRA